MNKLNKSTAKAVIRRAITFPSFNDVPGRRAYVFYKSHGYFVSYDRSICAYVVLRRCDEAYAVVDKECL